MTKPEFANAPNGTVLRFSVNMCLYRIHSRLCRKLVMQRITPQASASLVEIVSIGQRGEWEVEARSL